MQTLLYNVFINGLADLLDKRKRIEPILLIKADLN